MLFNATSAGTADIKAYNAQQRTGVEYAESVPWPAIRKRSVEKLHLRASIVRWRGIERDRGGALFSVRP